MPCKDEHTKLWSLGARAYKQWAGGERHRPFQKLHSKGKLPTMHRECWHDDSPTRQSLRRLACRMPVIAVSLPSPPAPILPKPSPTGTSAHLQVERGVVLLCPLLHNTGLGHHHRHQAALHTVAVAVVQSGGKSSRGILRSSIGTSITPCAATQPSRSGPVISSKVSLATCQHWQHAP